VIVTDVGEVPYRNLWADSFEIRYCQFRSRSLKVAYYYAAPDYGTFRYRVYNMVCAILDSDSDISASYFTSSDMPLIDRVLAEADALVLCRARYDQHVAKLITLAKRRGCRIIYDVDDLVFDVEQVHLLVSTIGAGLQSAANWDFWFGYVARIAATIAFSDKVLVTTEPLAAAVQSKFGKPTQVLPNFLNQQQIEISDRVYNAKEARGFQSDGTIHLGYFSGTRTHNHDYELACDALSEILKQHPKTRLRIVGYLDVPEVLYEHFDRIERLPIQDFINLQRTIGSTEINLVPLQDNIFTNCKSGLKFFEAAVVGTVSVASPTLVFRDAIQHRTNGLLAKAHEWRDMIELLLTDMELYRTMAQRARLDAIDRHSWKVQLPAIFGALVDR